MPHSHPHCLEASLRTLASTLLGRGFAVAVRPVRTGDTASPIVPLPPALSNASVRRKASFLAGRACAHAALAELGSHPCAIPIGAAGAPVWPEGVVGSISHTDRLAAAVLARTPPVRGLGLDIEDDLPLDDARMVRLICRTDEYLPGYEADDPAHLLYGKLLFVVKEAVYKLHRPLGGDFLDFQDVRASLDMARGRFCAELVDPRKKGMAGPIIEGGFFRENGLIAALTGYYR